MLDETNVSNFEPLEVVDRGSETQSQMVENLKQFTQQDKGQNDYVCVALPGFPNLFCLFQKM